MRRPLPEVASIRDFYAFEQHVADFLHAADLGLWPVRDPRAMANAILGK